MINTYKVMVDKITGKMMSPVYPSDNMRPCPDEWVWVNVDPDTSVYRAFVSYEPYAPNEPIIDMNETYWSFIENKWINVPTNPNISLNMLKENRNKLLASTDIDIAELTDELKIQEWKIYRQQLRDMFINVSPSADMNNIIFPIQPTI